LKFRASIALKKRTTCLCHEAQTQTAKWFLVDY